ncbi:MAG: twin-arginine translocase TatA/TatE family subunit [Microbacteriaceae bacterium]
MSFGLTIEKLFLIGLVALLIVGPDRLPAYAAQLARLVKRLKGFAQGAESRLRDELGDDFDPAEWKKLDPRQYDPRRIIRDALLEEPSTAEVARPAAKRTDAPTPFDAEST